MNSYYLAAYDSRQVKPPGQFQVLSMQAQASPTGRLQAYFEIALNQTTNTLPSPFNIIYATGGVDGGMIQVKTLSTDAVLTPFSLMYATGGVKDGMLPVSNHCERHPLHCTITMYSVHC